jgi:hypothetical protein
MRRTSGTSAVITRERFALQPGAARSAKIVVNRRWPGSDVMRSTEMQTITLLRITMVHMYSVATKQRLFRSKVERFGEVGIRAEDILISIVENGFEDWYAGRL